MAKVILDMAVSLDGFVAGCDDDDEGLHDYCFAPSPITSVLIADSIKHTGAIIMGRRAYEIGAAQNAFADNPYRVPHFVISHSLPSTRARGAEQFAFVADIESALRQAQAAAADRHVVIGGGAQIAQQYLAAGLIDELQLYLVPKLLYAGVRLFDQLESDLVGLEKTRVIDAPEVTHLTFKVRPLVARPLAERPLAAQR